MRCFRRRYWKYCTKGMRTALYNMLGCESFISRSFQSCPRGEEQKAMIVSGFLNSGAGVGSGSRVETVELQAHYFYKKVAKKP